MGKFNAAKMSGSGDVAFQNNYNYLIDLLDNGYLAEGIVGGKRVRVDVNPRDGFRMNIDNTDVFYIDSTGDAVFSGNVTIDGGENGKIIITPTIGLQMLNAAGVQIGGTATIEGELASIASFLTDDATSPAFWAKIGTEGTLKGIIGYLRTLSTTDPAFSVTSGGSTTNPYFQIKAGRFKIYCEEDSTHTAEFMWIYVNDVLRLSIDANGTTILYDANGYARFTASSTATTIKDASNVTRFNATATATELKDASNVTRFNATATATEVLNAAGRKLLEASGVNTYLRSNGTANSYLQISDEEGHVYINGVAKANWA